MALRKVIEECKNCPVMKWAIEKIDREKIFRRVINVRSDKCVRGRSLDEVIMRDLLFITTLLVGLKP